MGMVVKVGDQEKDGDQEGKPHDGGVRTLPFLPDEKVSGGKKQGADRVEARV
jgi:hypothetical protein